MVTVTPILDGGEGVVRIYMTGPGTVTQFGNGIADGSRCLRFLVWIGPVVTGMAAGAIGLILGITPGNDLAVGGMTAGACQISTVITRIIG